MLRTLEDRRQRKSSPDLADMDEHQSFLLTEPEPIEIASGYSISVKYDEEGKPTICVKKYGDVDTRGLRREIERNYPGAQIQGLEKPQAIEVKKERKRKTGRQSAKNRKKQSL
jgi:hypothetical protein